ncbi:homocysteine-responsive endoplasmic reticulum-resident ubiquitin-like domain member 2 protein [Panulirus ornatus]|uniref:homocysteine-responsive endoplasmic reticulum-resident ubiquitin-like domain member 2 protein n=1 Tax=Panulirus ornatus TaxID=150431 RepID=UPI003A872A7E
MEGSVTLIIKAANQSVPDQRMDCDLNWSVSYLKDHLSSVHPSKPRVDEQRLIYSGQLLLDNLLLRNVLRHPTENNAYTIHLVCSPQRNSSHLPTSLQTSPPVNQSRLSPPGSATGGGQSSHQSLLDMNTNQDPNISVPLQAGSQQPSPLPDNSANSDGTEGIRRRNVGSNNGEVSVSTPQSIDATSAYPSQSQIPVGVLQASADPMQQMAAIQQMYAHYMAYIQYMQMGGGVGGIVWPQQMVQLPAAPNPASSTTAAATTATSPSPVVDQAEQQQQQQDQNLPADPQQQQQQPQIRMNAQGGEVEDDDDDEGMGRDWLDWIYVLSRMLVLLSIVYFYSTLSRFMIVVCIAMLLYLYQAGWFRPARRIEQPRPANENDINDIQDDRNNNINNNNNNNEIPEGLRNQEEPPVAGFNQENAANNEAVNNEGTDRVVEEIPVRPSILALSWTFLTTFFTSLIPEQPQAI